MPRDHIEDRAAHIHGFSISPCVPSAEHMARWWNTAGWPCSGLVVVFEVPAPSRSAMSSDVGALRSSRFWSSQTARFQQQTNTSQHEANNERRRPKHDPGPYRRKAPVSQTIPPDHRISKPNTQKPTRPRRTRRPHPARRQRKDTATPPSPYRRYLAQRNHQPTRPSPNPLRPLKPLEPII